MACKKIIIDIIVDNTPPADAHSPLQCEHGLSLRIDADGKKILCDMGRSALFLENAAAMGVNLADTDFAILSHAHNDHTGGATHFLKLFPDKKIYISEKAEGARFFSSRRGGKHSISPDEEIFSSASLVRTNGSCILTEDIALVRCTHTEHPLPAGNRYLTAERNHAERPDDFSHELSVALRTAEGLVVVSPCSHCGAINIMRSCCEFMGDSRVKAFVGGLHFVDDEFTAGETARFRLDIAREFPDTVFHTGHCTSDRAKEYLGTAVKIFRTGDKIHLQFD